MLMPLRILLLAAATLAAPVSARADSASLMSQAQLANPVRYSYAATQGAEMRATTDSRAFSIWWQPSAGTAPKGVIVTLHGHGSWATDEFYLWHPYAKSRGYAVLALQWWFGGGESTADYYTPADMYPLMAKLLSDKGVRPGSAMFVGYSRGSANSYALAALDHASTGRRHFGLVLSNAGGATLNYPPNQSIMAGDFGPSPYAGLSWAMYCGEKDPDPEINGCPAMNAARDWVTQYGANVVLFIDDPTGDHGGFMTNSANVETALATYATVLEAATTVPTCTLDASATSVSPGASVTLSAVCHPGAAAYTWTGGTCAGNASASCNVTPVATTTYTVAGSDAAGWGPATNLTITVADRAGPTVPTQLVATGIDTTHVTLGWAGATDDVGVSSYRVMRDGTQVASVAATTYADSGLAPATAYTYTVSACDAAGNCSAASTGLSVQTATPLTNVLSNTEADCLFNWGEDHYPAALSPARAASQALAPYYYRRYDGSNSYLGVSSTDNHLYYLDARGTLTDMGLAATWSAQAGCRGTLPQGDATSPT